MRNYSTGTTADVTLLAPTNPPDAAKSGLAFCKRTLGVNNRIILPVGGTPMPNLYVPFRLASYTTPLEAVSELVKMGYKYVSGLSNTESLPAPDTILIDNSTGVTSLVWNSASIGLQGYANASKVTGSIIQNVTPGAKPTAALLSVTVKDGISTLSCILVNGSPVFNTTSSITLNAVIDTVTPDKRYSDNVVCATYDYFNQYTTSPKYLTSPDLWLSVVPASNADICPSSTAINLVAPTAVNPVGTPNPTQPQAWELGIEDASELGVNTILQDAAGAEYNLTYPVTADNLGLLPTTYLGNTIVTQGTATATYQGYQIVGSNVIINVSNPSGVFNASTPVTIALDFSKSGFSYLDNEEISSYALGFANIPNQDELLKYPAFVAGIAALQSPRVTKNRKYRVKGYYGFAFQSLGQYQTIALKCPDNDTYKASIVFDVSTKFQVSTTGYGAAMMSMFMDLNSEYPYYSTSGVGSIINIPASQNPASWVNSDVINYATGMGWTVFAPSKANNLHYVYRNVCTLQTLSSREDAEYRYMEFQLKLRYYVKNSVEIAETTCTNPDGTRKNNDPGLISTLKTNLETLQATLQGKRPNTNPILGADCSVTVTLNPNDVTKTLISEYVSIISGNSGNEIKVYVSPYTQV